MPRFVLRSPMPVSASVALEWLLRPGAFERLAPPWQPVRVLERSGTPRDGGRVVLQTKIGPFWRTWIAQHRDYVPGSHFQDEQIRGPFRRWIHTHRVIPSGNGSCFLEDDIDYTLPAGLLGSFFGGAFARHELQRVFRYRHEIMRGDLALPAPKQSLRILVSGATGLIGRALIPFLQTRGHQVTALSRHPRPGDIGWDPEKHHLEGSALEGFEAIVHLAGENIAAGRWTEARKKRILQSRIQATELLTQTIDRLNRRPDVFLTASAVGYYGDQGSAEIKEDAAAGKGFLSTVCRAWEEASQPLEKLSIRVAALRLGVVISPAGGALAKMSPAFKAGFGATLGNGEQYMSWVAIDDVVGAIEFLLRAPLCRGPVNVTAPVSVTNADWTSLLGRVLHRPTVLNIPSAVLRMGLGEMAEEALLTSTRAIPTALGDAGYIFRYPELRSALEHVMGRQAN